MTTAKWWEVEWICQVQETIRAEDPPEPEPEPEPTPEPVVVAPEPEPTPEPVPVVEDRNTPDWRDRRIAKLTAQLREAQAKPAAGAPLQPAPVDDAALDRRVQTAAQELSAQREFDRLCNDAANAGRTAFPDFDGKLKEVLRLVDPADSASIAQYNTLLAAALETGKAHEVLYALGGDLNEASRVMGLPPLKMAMELARMTADSGGKEPSKLGKPPTPVGQRGAQHTEIDPRDPDRADKLSTRQWMERRERQLGQSA